MHTRRVLGILLALALTACADLTGPKPKPSKPACTPGTPQWITDSTYVDATGQTHAVGHVHICGMVTGQPVG